VYDRKTVRRRRAVLALFVGLSLITLTAYFGESSAGPLHTLQRGVLTVVSPIQEGANRALKPVRDLAGWFDDTLEAKDQRDALRAERDRLRGELVGKESALRENEQLRKLVRVTDNQRLASYTGVTGRVIGQSPTVWYATVTINVGRRDGVTVDDPVRNGEGLVGRVSEVTPNAAQVTLITDHTSAISARVNRNGAPGLVRPDVGDPKDLLLDYIGRGKTVRKGDRVVTAGTSAPRLKSLFPPGIPIGTVARIDEAELDLYQRVHIKPFADLRRLDFVQVLTRPSGDDSVRAEAP
jgi:rod shape-determining protein MreC